MKSALFLVFRLSLFWAILTTAVARAEQPDASTEHSQSEGDEEEHHDIPPAHAVLFPVLTMTFGVVVFYILTRYFEAIPYTATLFLMGTLMGIGAELTDSENQFRESLLLWIPIDSEVLLLVFLPGLIFKDAYGLNVHLFTVSIGQCLLFAFPLVLAGTGLTALVAKYIFPYDWSLDLAFTFGSILSATDPVAVAALMDAVGAPPRLKIHVAGESLLNDGAAIVFFSIFSERYYSLLGIEGLGEEVDWGAGIKMFVQMSVGGVAIGAFFGLGLLWLLQVLNHRFSLEENVVEVMATAAIAYTCYYVSEVVWGASGVIATLTCGVLVKFLGRAVINDAELLDSFWILVEHILNTVLFTLGGVVWGAVIARGESEGIFKGSDWGYLILLYILLHAIRGLLFLAVFPLTKSIGLSTSLKETSFQVFGGLRGAIGIALALSLDNKLREEGATTEYTEQASKLLGLVGGIAFMTLTINGILAGPLIRKLGLTQSSEARKKILKAYESRYKFAMIEEMVILLSQPRFSMVNFAVVKHHVPLLAGLTKQQLREAVEKHRDTTPKDEYSPPYLKRILPYLEDDAEEIEYQNLRSQDQDEDALDTEGYARKIRREQRTEMRRRRRTKSNMRHMLAGESLSTKELRLLYISILRAAYEQQVRDGELADREFLTVALFQSLDFATDAASNGSPLKDWEYVSLFDIPVSVFYERVKKTPLLARALQSSKDSWKHSARRIRVERSLAFMAAHRWADDFFRKEFDNTDNELIEAGKLVLKESHSQTELAAEVMEKYDSREVELVVTHKFCAIILNSTVKYIEQLVAKGMMKDAEAEDAVEEMQHDLHKVLSCTIEDHPGELPADTYNDTEDQEESKRNNFSKKTYKEIFVERPIPEERENEKSQIFQA